MIPRSKIRIHFLSRLFSKAKNSSNPPIVRLCRIYCVMAFGAALFIFVSFYAASRQWQEAAYMQTELSHQGMTGLLYLSRPNYLVNWVGLLMLVGAIVYGFKIARQASVDARRNVQLLQETQQRTMEIAALYDTLQDVSEKHELRALLQIILERAKALLSCSTGSMMIFRLRWKWESGCPSALICPATKGSPGV